jgi:CheY-like chemotaxis protein
MGYTMLLADDSVTTHRVMELTFAGQGIRVLAVTDGEQALNEMRAARPDILLAEVGLPRVDGYSLSEHVRSTPEWSDVPVLLMTGTFDVVDESRIRSCGAAGIIVRPFEPEVVIKRVKDLLGISPKEADPSSMRLVTSVEPPPRPAEPDASAGKTNVAAPAAGSTELPPVAVHSDVPSAPVPSVENSGTSGGEGAAVTVPSIEKAAVKGTGAADEYLDQLDDAFSDLDKRLSGSGSGPTGVDSPVHLPAPRTSHEPAAGNQLPPVFEIDEEWFGGALEAQRSKLATETHAPSAGSPAPTSTSTEKPTDLGERLPVGPDVPAAPETAVAPDPPQPPEAPAGPVADSFHALLGDEQPRPQPQMVSPAAAQPLVVSDEVVERIAARVAERLSEGVFVDTVRRVVEDVAERLVREEIERIRARVNAERR